MSAPPMAAALRTALRGNVRRYGMVIALAVIVVLFQILTGGLLLRRSTSPTCCCRTPTCSSWRSG
ncbi:hypothetical protein ACFQXA_02300 [Nocardiopsis composta]